MNNTSTSTPPFHAQSPDEVLEHLGVNAEQGLEEREIRERRSRYGPNRLRETRRRSAWKLLLEQGKSMVILVLAIAGVAALSLQQWAEGIAIAAVFLVNTGIGFFTEWRSIRSMEALREMGGDRIRVHRNGNEKEIDSEDLLPGDIVILESGDLIPADIRLIESNTIRINESALTGESVPVRKHVDSVESGAALSERSCMLYRGTTMTDGSGKGVVIATGMQTELGHISEMAEGAEKESTPLQKRLDQLGKRLAFITLSVAAVIAVVGLLAGRDPQRMIETAIALGVAAIPEGLPIVATIALAHGMHLMARRQALIKKLPAVETLGATRVILTDKTGTLTENRMTLQNLSTPAGDFEIDEKNKNVTADGETTGEDHPALLRIIEVGVLCNNASLRDEDSDREPEDEQGDPTETALLRAGLILGMERDTLLSEKPEAREVPFDSDLMMMATFHECEQGYDVAVKGAPDRVLEACDRVARENGDGDEPLDEETRRIWLEQSERMASRGLRLLAAADKSADSTDEDPYENLRFLGLFGLLDPPRSDVRSAIEECRAAGIRIVMVTGDQSATAAAIARKTGIHDEENPQVIHGRDLKDPEQVSDEERKRILNTQVFARISPEQKLHLVTLLQSAGMITAMTGDGVNDAPALKKADIGVAMGERGTDAARQVADMVLLDDAFPSIVSAVRHGRIIFQNIRKSVMFMLCTNVAEVIAVALAALAGAFLEFPIPLLPLQILYLNVITDVFPALALGMGKGTPGIMHDDPRPSEEPILTRSHWFAIGGWAMLISACVLAGLAAALYFLGFEQRQAVTISFLTLGFGKLWFVYNLRSPGSRLLSNEIVRNPYVAGAIALCAALLVAAVYVPVLSDVLQTRDPGLHGWLLLLGLSLVPLFWGQTLRTVQAK